MASSRATEGFARSRTFTNKRVLRQNDFTDSCEWGAGIGLSWTKIDDPQTFSYCDLMQSAATVCNVRCGRTEKTKAQFGRQVRRILSLLSPKARCGRRQTMADRRVKPPEDRGRRPRGRVYFDMDLEIEAYSFEVELLRL